MSSLGTLPIRVTVSPDELPAKSYPSALSIDANRAAAGLPWLEGGLKTAAPQRLTLRLRIHNRAGIPIIEGLTEVQAGERRFVFQELRAIGIEAYAHKNDGERIQIAQRVWSRRTYGTLASFSTP
jgi:hypothetical protein